MKEANISRLIMVEASRHGHRLFLNARGRGWVGGKSDVRDGVVTLKGAAQVTFGVGPDGASDLIGWTRDGRFAAIEVKKPGQKPRPEQFAFIEGVRRAGGVAGWATSADEAMAILGA